MEANRHHGRGLLAREDACHWYHRLPLSPLDMLGYLTVFGLLIYFLFLSFGTQPSSGSAVALSEQKAAEIVRIGDSSDERLQDDVSSRTQPSTRDVADLQSGLPDMYRVFEELKAKLQRPQWALLDSDIVDMQRTLNQLVGQGSAALPAIRHYLNSSSDAEGAVLKALGYPTLRLALFDVVAKIGGSQAEDIFYRELQLTPSPLEIATLGRYLTNQAPGLYEDDILSAARNRFELVQSEAGQRVDAGPLFEVFSQYGDASLVPELENISQLNWGQYGAVALSRIPDGAGLGSLSRWVEQGPVGNTSAAFALRILAQSSEYPEAQQALLNSVREERIPRANWNEIARLLMGTYHIQLEPPEQGLYRESVGNPRPVPLLKSRQYISLTPAGPQVLYGLQTSEPALSPEQVTSRLELINALLDEAQDPVARRELIRAENVLWKQFQQRREQ